MLSKSYSPPPVPLVIPLPAWSFESASCSGYQPHLPGRWDFRGFHQEALSDNVHSDRKSKTCEDFSLTQCPFPCLSVGPVGAGIFTTMKKQTRMKGSNQSLAEEFEEAGLLMLAFWSETVQNPIFKTHSSKGSVPACEVLCYNMYQILYDYKYYK